MAQTDFDFRTWAGRCFLAAALLLGYLYWPTAQCVMQEWADVEIDNTSERYGDLEMRRDAAQGFASELAYTFSACVARESFATRPDWARFGFLAAFVLALLLKIGQIYQDRTAGRRIVRR